MERSEQSCDFNFADMDPREIGECLTPADKKMWLEMGIRLAGNEFMAKHKKKSGTECLAAVREPGTH